jgi:segregation and condensation protein B
MNAQLDLPAQLEAILFWKGEPMALKRLAELTHTEAGLVHEALGQLESRLAGRGLQLVFTGEQGSAEVVLGTAALAGQLIEKLTKEELIKDLGKAGLETLAIILYQGPASRKDIEYIRGVNCSYIIRNLLIRGLVEKTDSPKSANSQKMSGRGTFYAPTALLLSYLGVSRISDLPEFAEVQKEIEKGMSERDQEHS